MTQKSEERVPQWLAVDLLILCVPLAIIGLTVLVAI
jgi:hypothetical protein